jgi:hypothetical protein
MGGIMARGVVIDVYGKKSITNFTHETALSTLQKKVGGYVEALQLPSLELTLWCDEEGLLHNREPNFTATKIIYEHGINSQAVIVGDVVITSDRTDDEGNILDMTDEQLSLLIGYE